MHQQGAWRIKVRLWCILIVYVRSGCLQPACGLGSNVHIRLINLPTLLDIRLRGLLSNTTLAVGRVSTTRSGVGNRDNHHTINSLTSRKSSVRSIPEHQVVARPTVSNKQCEVVYPLLERRSPAKRNLRMNKRPTDARSVVPPPMRMVTTSAPAAR